MLISYDSQANAIYIKIKSGVPVYETLEFDTDIFVDLDINGQLLGIELLDHNVESLQEIADKYQVPDLRRVHPEKLQASFV